MSTENPFCVLWNFVTIYFFTVETFSIRMHNCTANENMKKKKENVYLESNQFFNVIFLII